MPPPPPGGSSPSGTAPSGRAPSGRASPGTLPSASVMGEGCCRAGMPGNRDVPADGTRTVTGAGRISGCWARSEEADRALAPTTTPARSHFPADLTNQRMAPPWLRCDAEQLGHILSHERRRLPPPLRGSIGQGRDVAEGFGARSGRAGRGAGPPVLHKRRIRVLTAGPAGRKAGKI